MSTAKPSFTRPAVEQFHAAGDWEWGPPAGPGQTQRVTPAANLTLSQMFQTEANTDRGRRRPEAFWFREDGGAVSPRWLQNPNQLREEDAEKISDEEQNRDNSNDDVQAENSQ